MADDRYLIAVASSDGIVVNNHFGHAATGSNLRKNEKLLLSVTPVSTMKTDLTKTRTDSQTATSFWSAR